MIYLNAVLIFLAVMLWTSLIINGFKDFAKIKYENRNTVLSWKSDDE